MQSKGKKAQGAENIVDVLSILSIVIIFLMFSSIIKAGAVARADKIEKDKQQIGNEINFFNYLRYDLGNGKTVSDLIVESYANDNYEQLKQATNVVLNKMYDKQMKWSLFINSELAVKEKGASETNSVIDSEIFLPTYNGEVIRFRLVVENA